MKYADLPHAIQEDRKKRRELEEKRRRLLRRDASVAAEQARACDPSDPFAARRAASQVLGGVARADEFGKNSRP